MASNAKPTPPAAPAPGLVANDGIDGTLERRREPEQPPVEVRDIGLGRALLRAVDGGRAVRPEQRIGDIAGDRERHIGESRIEAVEIGLGRIAIRLRAEPAKQARSAVRRGAAADPEHDRRDTGIERVPDQFSGPHRARRDRIAFTGFDE